MKILKKYSKNNKTLMLTKGRYLYAVFITPENKKRCFCYKENALRFFGEELKRLKKDND